MTNQSANTKFVDLNGDVGGNNLPAMPDTVGKNAKRIAEYVRNQLQEDILNFYELHDISKL